MSEKTAKPAKAKKAKGTKAAKDATKPAADPGVLGNLPASRPQRIGGRRRASAAEEPSAPGESRTVDAPAAAAKRAKPRKAAGAKPAAKGGKATRPGKAAKPAKRRAPAAAGAEAPAKRRATASAAAEAPTKRRASASAEAQPAAKRPRPVRAGAPALADPIADARERAERESPEAERRAVGPPTGPELVTTAFQAAGELAQIGVSVWTQTLKRAIERLPKP